MAELKGERRARYVAEIFARISRRYDLLNTIMSAGRHHAWRRMAVDMVVEGIAEAADDPRGGVVGGPALDAATGTGDFAFELARRPAVTHVVAVDFVSQMLSVASGKAGRKDLARRVGYVVADAHILPFDDGHFVCATVGFGIRNFVDVPRALAEMVRVLRPGGRLAVLEIVPLEGNGLTARVSRVHFRHVTPWLGAVVAGDREAYTYLPESVQGFLSPTELASAMGRAGLREVTVRRLALGSVAIVVGMKPRAATA